MKRTRLITTVTAMAVAASLCSCTTIGSQTEETTESAAETTTAAAEETTQDSEATEEVTEETEAEVEEEITEDDALSYDAQIDTIVNCKDTWFSDPFGEDYYFAVTDYDNNGRLEINYATIGGSGAYTIASIYEVNEDNSGITECRPDVESTDGFFYPDMISDVPVRVFFDGTKYTYIFSDFVHISNLESTLFTDAFVLENGKIKIDSLASWYQHEDGTEKFTNGEDEEIDQETFENIVDTVFADQQEISKVLTWIPVSESEDLRSDLFESLGGFVGAVG